MLILHHQKQMISVAQAHAVGMSRGEIRWRVQSGHWQRVYRGVYATFSGELSREARLWAVVLRMGDDAALSHDSAAEQWGFGTGATGRIHVTVPAKSNPARWTEELRAVVVHRSANWEGYMVPLLTLPCTPVPHTILDLVASARTHDDAYAWLSRAVTRRKATTAMVAAALPGRARMPRKTWLTDALTDITDGVHFPLERRWTRDVERAHGLPKADRQSRREGREGIRYLDNFYEPFNLAVELDGLAFHPTEDLDKDRRRDNEATIAHSTRTLRYGFKEVANRPCEQAEQFGRALVKQGWPASTLKPCGPACPVNTLVRAPRPAAAR